MIDNFGEFRKQGHKGNSTDGSNVTAARTTGTNKR